MIPRYDAAVIGAGLMGCFVSRNLARYGWSVAVFEKNADVCAGMSKANTAIIYPGYDTAPGSLKSRLNREAIRNFERLCSELGVRYRRTGSMMVAYGPRGDGVIRQKYRQGMENRVAGLELLSGAEASSREPNLRPGATCALYAESTATLNPWELGIAAAENAAANGVEYHFGAEVTGIFRENGFFWLAAGGRTYSARAVVNCAGLFADDVNNLINRPRFRLKTSAADYLLLDRRTDGFVRRILMHEPEEKGKGATVVPTVSGNLLLGPSHIPNNGKTSFESTRQGCRFVEEASEYLLPGIPLDLTIRRFAGIRPSIVMLDGDGCDTSERVHDLCIYESEHPGFINLAGIKTPGLTCSNEIGGYVAELLLERLGNPGRNMDFDPGREPPVRFMELTPAGRDALAAENGFYGKIVCRCEKITEGEIREAIRKTPGTVTLDGVKRRSGARMGRCQGGFCTQRILEIIADETGLPVWEIVKDGGGSELLYERI